MNEIRRTVEYSGEHDFGKIVYWRGDDALVSEGLKFQHGPLGQEAPQPNGVQTEEVIALLELRLRALDQRLPCRENDMALQYLQTARLWLEERTRLRLRQGVEGTEAPHATEKSLA